MYNSIIFVVVAFAASIPYAATLEREQQEMLDLTREKCIQSIYRTFDDIINEHENFRSDTDENYLAELKEIFISGLKDVNMLIGRLREQKSMDTVQRTLNFAGHPIFCDTDAVKSLSEIVEKIRVSCGSTTNQLGTTGTNLNNSDVISHSSSERDNESPT